MFKNAIPGDKVWSVIRGYGIVCENPVTYRHNPIQVQFTNSIRYYTLDGKLLKEDRYPELYWRKWAPKPEMFTKPVYINKYQFLYKEFGKFQLTKFHYAESDVKNYVNAEIICKVEETLKVEEISNV